MAKKKAVRSGRGSVVAKRAGKSAKASSTTGSRAPSSPRRPSTRAASTGKSRKQPIAGKKTSRGAMPVTLGRPRVTAQVKLDEVFKRDFEAREVFQFLRVSTLKELEELTPDEIIGRLTAPMMQTVSRIRKALALANRCLKDDQRFAVEFKQSLHM